MTTLTDKIEQVKLTMSRLNGMWSFTGEPLCWEVDVLLQQRPSNPSVAMLFALRAYGCLASRAQLVTTYKGKVPNEEWERLYADAGQALMFDLPMFLESGDRNYFDKLSNEYLIKGINWGNPPIPSPQ